MAAGKPLLTPVLPGQVYWDTDPPEDTRLWIVLSRESLNRGGYVVVVPLTTSKLAERRTLRNCVPFKAGEFGIPKDCVAQSEAVTNADIGFLRLHEGAVGTLSDSRLRDLVRAVGYMMDSECEPA